MYACGLCGTLDYVQAHKWYSLAIARSPPGEHRDLMERNRDEVEAKMNPDQVAEAE